MAYPKKRHPNRLSLCAWVDRLFLILTSLFIHHCWLEFHNVNNGAIPALILPSAQPEKPLCAVNKGTIIVSLVDLLAYNLLQIAFARRMAEELCWDVVIRPFWNVGLEPKYHVCFPNALQRNVAKPSHINRLLANDTILEVVTFNPKNLTDMDSEWHEKNQQLKRWSKKMRNEGVMWSCNHPVCNFTESYIRMSIDEIRRKESKIRLVYLENYFVHEEWLDQWRPTLKKLFTPKFECCSFPFPPSNAVVIHIHNENDFPKDRKTENIYISGQAYIDWLVTHNYIGRPLWIICQLGCEARPEVNMLIQSPWDGMIVYPRGQLDTICLLSHASILMVAPQSMLSAFAATLVRPNAIVHYPTTGEVPYRKILFSLTMPDWNYHRVANDSSFAEWNVSLKSLQLRPSWTFS